ncbi:hypothetical protein [Heyndrickxia acidicola]|uniref:Uncharacterized protein n=1 Tax=Heyndrickxia acidicola TaxID=209389 RepID=A0ABU6MN65_9BACI|nr:hypothetical protein [Heyndrickxia acidicola]MED1205837.1 hypothetical protein [Heyndrickxia acidicola]
MLLGISHSDMVKIHMRMKADNGFTIILMNNMTVGSLDINIQFSRWVMGRWNRNNAVPIVIFWRIIIMQFLSVAFSYSREKLKKEH